MKKDLTAVSRKLRENSTDAEKLIWKFLRAKQFFGLKFKRQVLIGNYIVDFVCFEKDLVIELDGGQHAEQREEDRVRDSWLHSQGFTVLRFWNNEVFANIEGVLEIIRRECQ